MGLKEKSSSGADGNNGSNNGGVKKSRIALISIAVSVVLLCALGVYFAPKLLSGDKDKLAEGSSQNSETSISSETSLNVKDNSSLVDRQLSDNSIIASVVPQNMFGRYIESDTSFVITSKEDFTENELKERFALSTDTGFEFFKTADCQYTLKSTENFPKASVVSLMLNDEDGNREYSWAFQTADEFRVKSVYPANNSKYVSTDSGIEITFSEYVTTDDAEKYFEIYPKVSGKFKSYRSTLVFIPNDELDVSTRYTVTLKSGFLSKDGISLKAAETFSFVTSNYSSDSNDYCGFSYGDSETFLPGDPVVLELYTSDNLQSATFDTKLYQFLNADDYKTELVKYIKDNSTLISTDSLKSVYENNDKLLKNTIDEYNSSASFIVMPDNLSEGWYIADVKAESNGKSFHLQKFIQISPVSVYSSTLAKEAVFFINDAAAGKSAVDAEISYTVDGKSFSGKTDSDGTAKIALSEGGSDYGLLKITYGNRVYYDMMTKFSSYSRSDCYDEYYNAAEDYYTYIYTDREAYLSDDTIKIWGLIRPRFSKSPAVPDNMEILLGYDDTDGQRVPVKINKDGTFTAEVSYRKLGVTWGTRLSLMSDEALLARKYISIMDYVKPTYVIDVTTPEYVFLPKEPVDISVDADFFDGTPARDVTFSVEGYDCTAVNDKIKTDKNGHAAGQLVLNDVNSFEPQTTRVNAILADVENEYQYASGAFLVFYRDIMMESEFAPSDKSGTLKFNTYLVDPSGIETKEQGYYYIPTEEYRGAAADTTVKATLHCNWSEKTKSGEYYDFLMKKTVDTYNYTDKTEVVGTYTVSTKNGTGEFTDLPFKREDGTYYLKLEWNDTNGKKVEHTVYLYERWYFHNQQMKHNYTFSPDTRTFTENQDIKLSLYDNYEAVKINGGKIFYTVYSNEFISVSTADTETFTQKMTRDCIPNVNICGAYFDGRNVYPIYESWDGFTFDPKERKIVLNINTDKEKYSPADNASVTVKATDINGSPITGASVSISVVDEAAFAVMNQTAAPLSDIYSRVNYQSATQYYSYIEHSLGYDNAAEMGGGGDDAAPRRDFKDTTAFLTGITNQAGEVQFEFKLADNLTTWRATVQAVGENDKGDIYAGTNKAPIVVTKPLFISPVMLPTYVYGDDVTVSAVCNGETDGTTAVTAKLTGNGIDKELSAPAGYPIEFGKLTKGKYTVLFTASDGKNSDAVELPLEIVDTLLETEIFKTFDFTAQSNLPINPQRWPVYMNFYDKEYEFYSKVVNMLNNSVSGRLDFVTANGFAMKELGYITEQDYLDQYNIRLESGLAKMMDNSEPNIEVTALICAAAPELVDKKAAATAFYTVVNDEDSYIADLADAYLGLAALGEPVLFDVNDLISKASSFTYSNQMKLTLALALIGDFDSAKKYYLEFTKDMITFKTQNPNEFKAYIDGNDIQGDTKKALCVASVIGLNEADSLAKYLFDSKQLNQTYELEMMMYIKNYKSKYDGAAEIEYTLNGKTEKVKLDKFSGVSFCFGEEQYKNADIKVVSGEVIGNACYIGNVDEETKSQKLKVTKTFTPVGGKMEVGALVRVAISVSEASSDNYWYSVDDVIPSGARYVENKNSSYNERNGQRISGYISEQKSMIYYIRLVNSGEYVLESAVSHDIDNNWGKSERTEIIIEDYNENA